MMKKLIYFVLLISIAIMLCACGEQSVSSPTNNAATVNETEKKEILFNDIPWGTSYDDTLKHLKELYNIDFTEPGFDRLYGKGDTDLDELLLQYSYRCRNNGYRTDPFPNTATHFSVISTSTVQIAEHDALILLDFTFVNDGKEVKNNDPHSASLDTAMYIFSAAPDTFYTYSANYAKMSDSEKKDKKRWYKDFVNNNFTKVPDYLSDDRTLENTLEMLLQAKYGNEEFEKVTTLLYKGGNDSSVEIGSSASFYTLVKKNEYTSSEPDYRTTVEIDTLSLVYRGNRLLQKENYNIIAKAIEEEYTQREQEYQNSIKESDLNGL